MVQKSKYLPCDSRLTPYEELCRYQEPKVSSGKAVSESKFLAVSESKFWQGCILKQVLARLYLKASS